MFPNRKSHIKFHLYPHIKLHLYPHIKFHQPRWFLPHHLTTWTLHIHPRGPLPALLPPQLPHSPIGHKGPALLWCPNEIKGFTPPGLCLGGSTLRGGGGVGGLQSRSQGLLSGKLKCAESFHQSPERVGEMLSEAAVNNNLSSDLHQGGGGGGRQTIILRDKRVNKQKRP